MISEYFPDVLPVHDKMLTPDVLDAPSTSDEWSKEHEIPEPIGTVAFTETVRSKPKSPVTFKEAPDGTVARETIDCWLTNIEKS